MGGQEVKEAPVRSCIGARVSIGPSAVVYRGLEFHKAPLHSSIEVMISMRPQCTHVQGPSVQ